MKREQIKRKAIAMAKKSGLINLSVRDLSAAVGIPEGSFAYVMGCTFTDFVIELNSEIKETKFFKSVKNRTQSRQLRRMQIIMVAVKIAKLKGVDKITRGEVAEQTGLSCASIRKYFISVDALKQAAKKAL